MSIEKTRDLIPVIINDTYLPVYYSEKGDNTLKIMFYATDQDIVRIKEYPTCHIMYRIGVLKFFVEATIKTHCALKERGVDNHEILFRILEVRTIYPEAM